MPQFIFSIYLAVVSDSYILGLSLRDIGSFMKVKMKVKVTQSCLTLWDAMDYHPWNPPGQNTGVGSLSLLQGIFPTQGSNPGLLHCSRILYQLSHKGSPEMLTLYTDPKYCHIHTSVTQWIAIILASSNCIHLHSHIRMSDGILCFLRYRKQFAY